MSPERNNDHGQPWGAPPASTPESRIRRLYGALQGIHSSWEDPSARGTREGAAHLRLAQRLLHARPLHIVLNSPPACPLEEYVATHKGKEMIAAIVTLQYLHQTTRVGQEEYRRLWPFDDSLWTCLLRWSDYLLPLERYRVLKTLAKVKSAKVTPVLLTAVIGIIECIAALPDADAQAYFLSESNSALHTLVCLWVHWNKVITAYNVTVGTVTECMITLAAAWQVFDQNVATSLIGTQIMRIAGGGDRGVFRLCAAHLRILSMGAMYMGVLFHSLDIGPRTIPSPFVSTVFDVLNDFLDAEPGNHDVWVQIFMLLYTVCSHSDQALVLAIKHGLFPLTVRVRQLCAHCSQASAALGDDPQMANGITGALVWLIARTLYLPRAVRYFREAKTKYTSRISNIPLRKDEQNLVDLAERRHELLARAEREWSSVAKCCNPGRAHWTTKGDNDHKERCLHSGMQSCRPTLDGLRTKDVHFLVVIGRAYVEANYANILSRFCNRASPCTIIAFTLSLKGAEQEVSRFMDDGGITKRDACPYPTMLISLHYHQTDGQHSRMLVLHPRVTGWRRESEMIFNLINTGPYDPPAS
ncbi:hypothetical protein GGF50DRAFT_115861 [Schizophyllum commune]